MFPLNSRSLSIRLGITEFDVKGEKSHPQRQYPLRWASDVGTRTFPSPEDISEVEGLFWDLEDLDNA